MGLDGTIKRPDCKSLGSFAQVQSVLADIFPGVTLQRSLSGLEKLQTAEAQGITFPTILRKHMASTPAKYEGDYAGADFSIEFYADAADRQSAGHFRRRAGVDRSANAGARARDESL